MSIEPQRAQTLSALSTVLSAFLVFVIGGGVVLKVWADERKAAKVAPVVEMVTDQNLKSVPDAESKPTVNARPAKRIGTKKTANSKSINQRPSKRVKAAKAAKVSKAAAPDPRDSVPVSGKGQVVVSAGDASRVRLIGSNGTFGSGTVPAGNYTIQATFKDGVPRMAGTVKVADGQRIVIICKAAGQRCIQR